MTEATRKLYGGMDLHSSNVYCAIKDQDGSKVFKKRLPCELGTVLAALEPYREDLESIAVESTYNWYWLVDGLLEAGYPARLANPARMVQYEGLKVTDDKTDAFWLAEMQRLGILPEGYIYPKQTRSVRDTLRRRMLLSRERTRLLLSLASMATRHSGNRTGAKRTLLWTREDLELLFPNEYDQQTGRELLNCARYLDRSAKELEKQVVGLIELTGGYQRLMQIPGIGKVLGITIMLETGTIERFNSAGDYASYCRMVQSRRKSNDRKKGENNRKNGNKYLNWAYVEGANFFARHDETARRWFDRKKTARNRAVAVKALGCKMSKAVFYMLRDEVDFDKSMLFG